MHRLPRKNYPWKNTTNLFWFQENICPHEDQIRGDTSGTSPKWSSQQSHFLNPKRKKTRAKKSNCWKNHRCIRRSLSLKLGYGPQSESRNSRRSGYYYQQCSQHKFSWASAWVSQNKLLWRSKNLGVGTWMQKVINSLSCFYCFCGLKLAKHVNTRRKDSNWDP